MLNDWESRAGETERRINDDSKFLDLLLQRKMAAFTEIKMRIDRLGIGNEKHIQFSKLGYFEFQMPVEFGDGNTQFFSLLYFLLSNLFRSAHWDFRMIYPK